MITDLLFAFAIISFTISSLVLLLGKRSLWIIPSIRMLEDEEVFITKIKISHNAIGNEGETLANFTNKLFTEKHVESAIDERKLHNYVDRYKVGQILKIAFYYTDKKLDKNFKVFRSLCLIIFVLGLVILVAAYLDHAYSTQSNSKMVDSFNKDYLKYFSVVQAITFITLFIDLIIEVQKVDKLFDPRSS